MTTTSTPNKGLVKITAGTESGTWGPYVNNTTGVLDNNLGGTASIALSNASIVLSSAQYQNNFITLTGTLSANIVITLPAVGSFYTFNNLVSNPSAFSIALRTAAGGDQVGLPWHEVIDVITDGSNVKLKGLEPVGTYLDIAAQSIPNWISACTVPPYLYCNGATFSSATYPGLRTYLNSNVLPDCRGRTRFSMDGATGRNTAWISGDTLLAGGGGDTVAVSVGNLPWEIGARVSAAALAGGAGVWSVDGTVQATTGMPNRPPAIIGGITMIRAA